MLAGTTALLSNAQITITQWDIAIPPKVIMQAHDSMPTINAGSPGTNKTWNFSSLQSHQTDTMNFTNPQWTPYQSSFPTANLAIEFAGTGFYAYLSNTATGLSMLGQAGDLLGTGTPMAIAVAPPELLVKFPCTYNTAFTNTSRFNIKMPFTQTGFDSLWIKSTKVKSALCDAWGTVTTPLGSFNAIRVKETNIQFDTILLHTTGPFPPPMWVAMSNTVDTSYIYAWYANGVGYPLVQLDSATDGSMTANWLMAQPSNSINEINSLFTIPVYPNPSNGQLVYFDMKNIPATSIEITDISGKIVYSEVLSNPEIHCIKLSHLENGAYIYQIRNNKKNLISTGKLTITH